MFIIINCVGKYIRLQLTSPLSRTERILDLCTFSVVEDNIETGEYIVGRGGYPNSDGIVQLDAAIMNGEGCQFGGVAALEG